MAVRKRKTPGPAADELRSLYLQPPEHFTQTRDELARSLRERGEREAAQEVKKLRRPSQAAWLVNQLALREPSALEEMLGAGQRLRDVEEATLAGKADAAGLRTAAEGERQAIAHMIDVPQEIAANDGLDVSPATLERVAETLQASGADPELAKRVRAGRLDKEARSATIGVSTRAPAGTRKAGRAGRSVDDQGGREQAQAELESASRDLERAEQRRDRALDDVNKHSERLKQARAELAEAKRDVKSLQATVRRSEQRAKRRS
jgi:phosphoglycolate phosphatase-like HAD superfamily hydrolase